MTTSTITSISFARSRVANAFSNASALPLFIMLLLTAPAAAESYTFTKGIGAWSPGSVERTVVVPCHASPVVKLSGTRFDHYDSDIPVTIEFRAPGVSLASGPTHTRVLTVTPENKPATTFTVPGHSSGCGSPWRIRIVPYAVAWESRIVGDFSVSFTSTVTIMNIEDAATLANGRTTTKNIGGPGGLHQGWVEIIGTWNQSVFGVPGPLPVKLNFELRKPDGSIAAYDTGHSNHEVNPCCSGDKMKIRFRVTEHINGQWTVRIKNDSGSDVMTLVPKATFKPACQ